MQLNFNILCPFGSSTYILCQYKTVAYDFSHFSEKVLAPTSDIGWKSVTVSNKINLELIMWNECFSCVDMLIRRLAFVFL